MALRRYRAGLNTGVILTGATTSFEYINGTNGTGDKPLLIKKILFSLTSDARVTWAFIMSKAGDVTPHGVMMDDMDYTSYRFKTAQYESLTYMEKFKTGIVVPPGMDIRIIARQENVNNAQIFGESVIWVVEDV